MKYRWLAILLFLAVVPWAGADEPAKKKEVPGINVPYRRTDTQHILVRAKLNGKGPLNFIIDTGAPIMFVSIPAAKKIGIVADKGWTVLDQLEIEGGVKLDKVKCRVETPFQLEGMNGMNLAGAELHGIIGYTVLAKYKMEIDFTSDKMVWTPLNFKPPPPQGIGGGGGAQAGLEMIGTLMKFLGFLAGTGTVLDPAPRGFVGMELSEKDNAVTIEAILDKSPAKEAGLKSGDRLLEINGQGVKSIQDARRMFAQATAGQTLRLLVRRGDKQEEIRVAVGEGL